MRNAVFLAFGHLDVMLHDSRILVFFALQHRGQESAGIAVGDGATVLVRKDLGLVSQVFFGC